MQVSYQRVAALNMSQFPNLPKFHILKQFSFKLTPND